MNVLVVGSGGREHALVWKLAQSPQVSKIFAAPGNAGMKNLATCLPVAADDIDALVQAAQDKQVDLTLVGPEKPLTMGIVDAFEKAGLPCFGPSKAAARIEGSKAFSKQLMQKYNIPTARFDVFSDLAEAKAYVHALNGPCVVKADGLAAGKGVIICPDEETAYQALEDMLSNKAFGEAGQKVLVEEFLQGQEVSILAFADGKHVLPMVSAQDHKRIFDGDEGPNTGGMGAYSPAPIYTEALAEEVLQTIIKPTVAAMAQEGCPFTGILYTGLMLTADGPKVLEYNARFGDPETQPVLMRLASDLLEPIQAALAGKLDQVSLTWRPEAAVCVVLAAENYPASPRKGDPISGIDKAENDETVVFQAGTREDDKGRLLTSGGRVLGVTALGEDIKSAMEHAYKAVAYIDFDGMQYRHDIGMKALEVEG
ncbi:phosphoribosylamine--glycine ligase [Peptococcus niger]|uniref:Phosphoribosylamine--glycine ligase n=1 Tax=Peptococcus niger TaxID=2741 RepID=A0A1G6XM88_PEPNI|nr:phosphoribosylamine--glycine ligase [Peptococcus niger]SDD78447.1 phosphoribosylamine--glycine ligase [Peptococcus niger]